MLLLCIHSYWNRIWTRVEEIFWKGEQPFDLFNVYRDYTVLEVVAIIMISVEFECTVACAKSTKYILIFFLSVWEKHMIAWSIPFYRHFFNFPALRSAWWWCIYSHLARNLKWYGMSRYPPRSWGSAARLYSMLCAGQGQVLWNPASSCFWCDQM